MLKLISTGVRQLQRGVFNGQSVQTIVIRKYQKLEEYDLYNHDENNQQDRYSPRNRYNQTERYNPRDRYSQTERYNPRDRYGSRNSGLSRSNYRTSGFRSDYARSNNNRFINSSNRYPNKYGHENKNEPLELLVGDVNVNKGNESLPPFEKGAFALSPSVTGRPKEEVDAYRKENNIQIHNEAEDVPNPIQTFEEANFDPISMKYIRQQGWRCPTPIQAQSWSVALTDKNLIAVSPTGSGKTLAFVLPALEHIKRQKAITNNSLECGLSYKPIVLIVVPTRELARQVHSVILSVSPSSVTSICMHGGQSDQWYHQYADTGIDICVSTIGRLVDNLNASKINLKCCTYMVVDEADEMLKGDFLRLLTQIFDASRPDKQILLYTATWNFDVERLVNKFIPDRVRITIDDTNRIKQSIKQTFIVDLMMEKPKRLLQIMSDIRKEDSKGKIIIFANTIKMVTILGHRLDSRMRGVHMLHGNLTQNQRNLITEEFRRSDGSILVATDVAARGLDIGGVDYIINYNFPTTVDMYIHRIGRCGRQQVQGTVYTFLDDADIRHVDGLIEFFEKRGLEVDPALLDLKNISKRRSYDMRSFTGERASSIE